MSFETLGLMPELLHAVRDNGYETPTPVQAQAIPLILAGRDLLAGAQTGTGKTAGFVLPILQLLAPQASTSASPARHPLRCLILTPTRELAMQVEESVRTYGKYLPLRSATVFGGVNINPQVKALRAGVEILVATPGRLLDHHQQGNLNLSQVEFLVLDEADRMLDMGFIRDIRRILALLPAQRQNLLFSATFSDEIRQLAGGLLNDPASVDVAPRNSAAELVEHLVHPVDRERKRALLSHLHPHPAAGAGAGVHPHQARRQPPVRAAGDRRHRRLGHPRQQEPARSASRPWRTSRRARSPCWWPPTSPPGAWTSASCPTWSTTSCPRWPRTTCTASAAPAAPAPKAWP